MNIKEAREEIIRTVEAYTKKKEDGSYTIPLVHQRPLFLVGPPGIGKTAIVEQAARTCNVGIVAYTITHHTRQSAIGLPTIMTKTYDGEDIEVTEYTMSEIIASIYDYMELTGYREGILFIDEINCVSETLAPTMLQFLQYKTFGTHKVPKGWIIVTAGNPSEYNKSVKEFDLATLDRVRRIEVEADFLVWKEYALEEGVHESIISYLSIKKQNFYHIEINVEGTSFVTARGWEDLSRILMVYQELDFMIEQQLIEQFIQDKTIARDFAVYLELYKKYSSDYQIEEILSNGSQQESIKRIKQAPLDERLSVISLLIHALAQEFKRAKEKDELMRGTFSLISAVKNNLLDNKEKTKKLEWMEKELANRAAVLQKRREEQLITQKEQEKIQKVLFWMEKTVFAIKKENLYTGEEIFTRLKEQFNELKEENETIANQTGIKLQYAFDFIKEGLGEGIELALFISDLVMKEEAVWYLSAYKNEDFFYYNKKFHFKEREKKLQEEIAQMQETLD